MGNEKPGKGLAGEYAWLGTSRQLETREILYGNAVEMARNPAFFSEYGVADTVDGRFDSLALVVALVMRRLKDCGAEGQALSQQLFDTMFSDMDLSLRKWAPAISESASG